MPIIGAHVKGGIKGGVAYALDIQAQAMQIFVGSPQTWRAANPAPDDVARFKADVAQHGLGPNFVHAIYLVNLAAERMDIFGKSLEALRSQLKWADGVGAQGLIFHPGSAGTNPLDGAKERVAGAIGEVLRDYTGSARLLLETCAGQGATIGRCFADIGDIFKALDFDQRLGICIDTCHVFNAGYDITTESGLEAMLEEADRYVGLDRLSAIHANDSKTGLGAQVDRHENIGQGKIGEEAFARMLRHPVLAAKPFILEVPGYEGHGPDLANVQTMRRLAGVRDGYREQPCPQCGFPISEIAGSKAAICSNCGFKDGCC